MFQNSYQNGSYFDFFDPKTSADKLKALIKISNLTPNCKVFDKDLKTYVMESLTPNAKMSFPKEDKKDLCLIQQYLVLQIYFFPGLPWHIQLTVSDLTKTKRRIILSPASNKLEIKPFFIKDHCRGWKEGVWNNFAVDLYSYIEAFKGQTYRSLDAIHLGGHFRLRRIYTTNEDLTLAEGQQQNGVVKPISLLPKQFQFPMGVSYTSNLNKFEADIISHAPSEITEPSTKNSSFLKSSKTKSNVPPRGSQQTPSKGLPKQERQAQLKIQQVKTQKYPKEASIQKRKVEIKKKRDFLSDTNGEMISRKKQRISIDKNAQSQKIIISTSTNIARPKPKEINNPWRTNKNTQMKSGTYSTIPRKEPERKVYTPQSNFKAFKKTRNQREEINSSASKRAEGTFSDSDYVELSQKFSTITDPKFLKNELSSNLFSKPDYQDEIEENIEMETNSYLQESRREEKQPQPVKDCSSLIRQSIGDSLDFIAGREKKQRQERSRIRERQSRLKGEPNAMQELGNSSLYGFGENLMRKFMHEIERPYSPPLGQRENHEAEPLERVSKDQVQLMYDPVLNCYYDYRTHTYYELKN